MVTILPPKTNVGSEIGRALGMGIQKGTERGLERGLTNQGFDQLIQSLGNDNPDLVNAVNVLRQGALNPGADRAAAALAPLMIGRSRTNKLYGKEARGGGEPLDPAEAAKEAAKFVEGEEPAGFLSPPMNPDQMQEYATQYAQVIGDPQAYDTGFIQAEKLNASREASRKNFENSALQRGITPEELPRYMQIATEFQHLKDPQAINREALNKFKGIKNNKEALRNLSAPATGNNLTKKGFGGLLSNLLSGKEGRQEYLKGYDELVKKLVNDGEEPYVREELAKLGLSPTEIEERIHPLTPEAKKAISSMPKGNSMNPKARADALVNFFRKNVTNDTSLAVLRNYLIKDKKYDWKEIRDAVSQAFPGGRNLTQYQSAETAHLSNAPRNSLIDIFRGTNNVLPYLRGEI